MIEGFELSEDALECDNAEVAEINIEKIEDLKEEQELSSKIYSKIFDTEYSWNVPYIIDVEKYKTLLPNTRLTKKCDYRTVDFSCNIRKGYCNKLHFTFFIFSKDYDEVEDNYHYDCLQYSEDKCSIEDFKNKVKEITSCIKSVDTTEINEIIHKKESKIKVITNEIQILNSFKI